MIEYQEKLQDFYKMRDTLITEGFNYPEDIKIFDKVEKREIALEIIRNVGAIAFILDKWLIQQVITRDEYDLLKEVLL